MAKQKISSQSRDQKFDFDFDKDADLDKFDNFRFDFGADTNTKSNRDPISHVRQGASAALSSAAKSFHPVMMQRLSDKIPEASRFLGDLGQITSDAQYLGTEFIRDINPTLQQLKRAGRAVGGRVKQFMPKSWGDKYDELMSDQKDRDSSPKKMNKEDSENLSIASSIEGIFSKGVGAQLQAQTAQAEDQKTETLIDRSLASKRHGESFKQLQSIALGMNFNQQFIEKIQIPLMKKDLELKYRHLFAAKDTLTEVKGIAKILEDKLDQIRHNTALPDIQKQTKMESLKEVYRERVAGKVNDWAKGAFKRLKSRVLDPTKDALSMAGSAAEMIGDNIAFEDETGGGPKGAAATAGGLMGMLFGNRLAKGTSKLLFGQNYGDRGLMSNRADQLNNYFKNFMTRGGVKLRALSEKHEGSFLGEILSIVAPDLNRGAGYSTNVMLKKPNDPASLTNQAVLSITTIMPGYLAKINKHLESLATGKQAEELVFDTRSNDFISVSTFQQKFQLEAFGSAGSRKNEMGRVVGSLRGIYKTEVGADTKNFDDLEEDMIQWLTNTSLMRNRLIEPHIIAEYAGLIERAHDDGDTGFNMFSSIEAESYAKDYIRESFKNVKHPEELCLLLSMLLFTKDGKVDRQTRARIENMQLELI